jgi:vitamin B12 transporter
MSKRIVLATCLFLSMAATAQDTTGKFLQDVVVTANKFPNKTSLTGKVVIVITQQDLARAGSRDLSQVLTEQGGVYLNGAFSNPGKDKSVYLRGAKVDHTLITIDGVPVYDASGIGSNFDIRLIPIESVERIEILKGSQSTLYGSDAIAGVINIITKKGGAKPVSVSGLMSDGSYNTQRLQAGINGRLKKWITTLATIALQQTAFPKQSRLPEQRRLTITMVSINRAYRQASASRHRKSCASHLTSVIQK